MGLEKEFKKVKLFSGFIFHDPATYPGIKKQLEDSFSPVDFETDVLPFDFTTYYNGEMGSPLYRCFVSFHDLIPPEQLPDIKLLTNKIEIETALEGKRTVNLDPGYLSEANIVIATTKNYYHRIPLAKGIYAHMEYTLKGNSLQTLEWTYPDFKSPEYRDFFRKLLEIYKRNLKEERKSRKQNEKKI